MVEEKSTRFDSKGSGIVAILAERERASSDPLAKVSRWTVGSHENGGVRFETFPSETVARERYETLTVSKVLFDVNNEVLECITAPSDKSGEGTAMILKLSRGNLDLGGMSVLEALEKGLLPFIPPDRPPLVRLAMKSVVTATFNRETVAFFSCGPLRNRSLCYYDANEHPGVEGYVALTIDDAPCLLQRNNSLVGDVCALLREHGAKATFMLVGNNAEGHEADLVDLLRDGHELANHGMLDRPYHEDTREEFSQAVSSCSGKILKLQREAGVPEGVRFFRAPHGKYTELMEEVLQEQGLSNVMCDCYAACPVIQDGAFIGEKLAKDAKSGSILLIHMPCKGVREWCYDGISRTLQGLHKKGLRVVTLTELQRLAQEPGTSVLLQWTRIPVTLASQWPGMDSMRRFHLLNPYAWSIPKFPEQVLEDLEKEEDNGAVYVRVAHTASPRSFAGFADAARWIRQGLERDGNAAFATAQQSVSIPSSL